MKNNKKMTRKTKAEKRRLAFEKRNVKKEQNFARYGADGGSALVMAKATVFNRRVVAALIAFAIVLGTLVVGINVMVRAEDTVPTLEEVSIPVRVNGIDNYATVSLQPGAVEDTIKNVSIDNLPDGAEYVKTVLIDTDGSEREIAGVGKFNGETYYSIEKATNVGTLLEENQAISIIYATKYKLTIVPSGEGTYAVNGENNVLTADVWSDADIYFQKIVPADDYYIDSISYTSGVANGTIAVEDGTATIPHSALRGDISVTLPFTAVSAYTISDARTMNQSKYYPRLKGLDNHGGTSSSTSQNNAALPSFAPGGEATFYIHSQSNSAGDVYILNMLSINGEDIKYPTGTTVGTSVTTPLSDGRSVVVTLNNTDFRYSGESRYKHRTLYEVKVSGFHENVEVAYNFKEQDDRTLIIKGLEGIDLTGMSVENSYLLDRYYTLDTNYQNIYRTYYTWMGDWTGDGSSWRPSNNLVVYTVKPGYNPYTISTEMYYNEVPQDSSKIRDTDVTGTPEQVIKEAGNASTGRYDTDYRYWGANTSLRQRDSSYRTLVNTELMLTTLQTTGLKWYGLALSQNAEKNQQLYLNATPYNYHLELDLNGGSLAVENYRNDNGTLVELNQESQEVAKHTHLDNNAFVTLPDENPTLEGMIFEGWQMLYANGSEIEGAIYQKMDRINVTDSLVDTIQSDGRNDAQAIKLVAKWSEPKHATRTNISIKAFVQVPDGTPSTVDEPVVTVAGKTYRITTDIVEGIDVDKKAAILNLHQPENAEYYTLRFGEDEDHKELTKLTTVTVAQDTVTDIPETNQLRIYYDYKTVNLNIEKLVKGKPKARNYNVTLRLTPPTSGTSPIDLNLARAMIEWPDDDLVAVDGDSLTYTFSIAKSQTMPFANVPYGWSYSVVEEQAADGDYISEIAPADEGVLTDDTDLVITNTGKNPGIEVNKTLSDEKADGSRSLTLESYATGESYVERLDSNIPLDIAIVVDQSGSMAYEDVGEHWEAVTNNWTALSAYNSAQSTGRTYYAYDRQDQTYYPVEFAKEAYYKAAPRTDTSDGRKYGIKIYGNFSYDSPSTGYSRWGLISRAEGNSNRPYYHYQQSTNSMHAVYYNTAAVNLRYDTTLFYYKNSKTGSSISGTTWGDDNSDWERAVSTGEVQVLGADWGYHWQTWGVIVDVLNDESTYFYPGTLYFEYTPTNNNAMYYTKDNGTKVYVARPKLIDETGNGTSETYEGPLYYVAHGSRMSAVKAAVNNFIETVGAQAEEYGVNHKVSVIGFASNEKPSSSSVPGIGSDNVIGESKYITTNTGIFVDGQFKNYMTPVWGNNTPVTRGNQFYAAMIQTRNRPFLSLSYDYEMAGHSDSSDYTNLVYFSRDGYPLRNLTRRDASSGSNTKTWWYLRPDANKTYDWYIYANATGTSEIPTIPSTSYINTSDRTEWSNNQRLFYAEQPYYPNMQTLQSADYQSALVSVSQNDSSGNLVNDHVDTAIDSLNTYGGTYIGYGMAMANNVFKYNDNKETTDEGKTIERKRVVIVFTDGMPGGGSTFDDAAANEALAAANIAKNEYGASVYTVGLYPQGDYALSEENQQKAESFLQRLSSEYYSPIENVYESELNPNSSYLFTDEDGRVHSVSARNSTKQNISFSTEVVGDREIPVEGSNGSVSQYVWRDSDGWLRAAYTDENDDRYNFYQFFTVGNAQKLNEGTYTFSADGSAALDSAFKQISEEIQYPTSTVKLDATHAFMRDTITDNFDIPLDEHGDPDLSKIKVEWVKGTWTGTDEHGNATVAWTTVIDKTTETVPDNIEYVVNRDGTKTLDIKNFDYSANYIAEGHEGYKLVVTVNGLTPAEGKTGILPSNTDESGIYKINDDNSNTLVAEFPIPSIEVQALDATVRLAYAGTHAIAGQRFDVEFMLTKQDGTPYSGTYGDGRFSSDGVYKTSYKDQDSKTFSNLPPKSKLSMTVSDPNGETVYYSYLIDEDSTDDINAVINGNEGTITINESKPNILISVTDTRQLLTVTNRTEGYPGSTIDYSDSEKEFPIIVKLLNSDESAITEDVILLDDNGNSVTFKNGEYEIELANGESEGFYIPNGYKVVVKDAEEQTQYSTAYQIGNAPEYEMTAETEDPQTITISTDHKADVIHRLAIDIVPTGILEENTSLGILLGILAGICAIAAIGSGIFLWKKKDEFVEE